MDPLEVIAMDSEAVDELFEQAARRGDVDEMRALLAQGADVNSQSGYPLELAALNDRTAAVQYLLDNGAFVDQRDGHRESPLHWASYNANSEIVGILLAAGADVHVTDELGESSLAFLTSNTHSTRGNRERCAELLLSHGARLDAEGRRWTPLYGAIHSGLRDLIKIFLRASAPMIATADLPRRSERSALTHDLIATIRAAGGWPEYVAKHRRVLASFVSKLSAKSAVPLDAASHLVAFWCPPGGY